MEIRELTEADVAVYWQVRLRALREEPESFGSSYEESKDRPLEQVAERFRAGRESGNGFTLGAFADGQLVGIVGFDREAHRKDHHIGGIYQMYTTPEVRGRGYGRALMEAVIARARVLGGVEQVNLMVVTTNTAARALYRSLGFEVYGHARHSLKLDDGRYLDEDLMVLWLIEKPSA